MPWDGVVPLAQVLRYALPAYGGSTLPESIATMRSEPSEEEVITALAVELAATPEGLFDDPIRVCFTDPDEWTEEDQAELGDRPILPRIGNGMHRVAAAHLAGVDHVRVTTEDLEEIASPFDGELVVVSYRVRGETLAGEDPFEFVVCWLRSFRLARDVWVEAASLGSCDATVEAVYHCPHRLRAQLLLELGARAARHGLTLEVSAARPVTWDDLLGEESG